MKNQGMSALKLIQKVKEESIQIGILFLVFFIVFKIFFMKSNIVLVFRTLFAIFWLSVIPGFYLMYYFVEKINFIERLIAGTILGFAISGLFGYNLGWMGIKVNLQVILVPIAALIVAGIIILRKNSTS